MTHGWIPLKVDTALRRASGGQSSGHEQYDMSPCPPPVQLSRRAICIAIHSEVMGFHVSLTETIEESAKRAERVVKLASE